MAPTTETGNFIGRIYRLARDEGNLMLYIRVGLQTVTHVEKELIEAGAQPLSETQEICRIVEEWLVGQDYDEARVLPLIQVVTSLGDAQIPPDSWSHYLAASWLARMVSAYIDIEGENDQKLAAQRFSWLTTDACNAVSYAKNGHMIEGPHRGEYWDKEALWQLGCLKRSLGIFDMLSPPESRLRNSTLTS